MAIYWQVNAAKNGDTEAPPTQFANQITTGKERLTNLSQIEYSKSIFNNQTNSDEKTRHKQKSTRIF